MGLSYETCGVTEERPYLDPVPLGGDGELIIKISDDGKFSATHKKRSETPRVNAKKVRALSDDCISVIGVRPSGIVDYRLDNVSVSYRGEGYGEKCRYLCHTCVVNQCPHTKRIDRYRNEHPLKRAA